MVMAFHDFYKHLLRGLTTCQNTICYVKLLLRQPTFLVIVFSVVLCSVSRTYWFGLTTTLLNVFITISFLFLSIGVQHVLSLSYIFCLIRTDPLHARSLSLPLLYIFLLSSYALIKNGSGGEIKLKTSPSFLSFSTLTFLY